MSASGSQPQPRRASSAIYLVVWFVQLPVAFMSLTDHRELLGLGDTAALWLALFSCLLLGLIYLDMHAIDELQGHDHDYPDWIGGFWEYALRVLILLFLLFGVGELASVIQHYVAFVTKFIPFDFSEQIVSFVTGPYLFVGGSLGAFLLIAVWNFCAIWLRWRNCDVRVKLMSEIEQLAHDVVVSVRIIVFLLLATLCTVYWLLIWNKYSALGFWAQIFVLVFVTSVIVVTLLRWKWTAQPFELLAAHVLGKVRKLAPSTTTGGAGPPPGG